MTDAEKLTEAFHLLFDVKDNQTKGEYAFVHCYNAIWAIERVMDDLGVTSPDRWDGTGR